MMSKWSGLIDQCLSDETEQPAQQTNGPGESYSVTDKRHDNPASTVQNEADTLPHAPEKNSVVYPPHPAAVALLLACCQLIAASRDELLNELLKLQQIPPSEQVHRWALACRENGLPPERVILPGVPSSGKAMDCMRCKNLQMALESRDGRRKQYHWSCTKQHAILEAGYLGERILLAPDTCNDYLS